VLREAPFRDPPAARSRFTELFRDPAEMLALARVSGYLKDALVVCPDPDAALLQLSRFVEVRGSRIQLYRMFNDHPVLLDRWVNVVSASRYLADILVRNPDYMDLLDDPRALSESPTFESLVRGMARLTEALPSEPDRLDALRRHHRRQMLRIGAADLLGYQAFPEVIRQISDLADAFVTRCLALAAGDSPDGGLVVLAVGKWGGRELNYSSDIDVLFLAVRAGDVPRLTAVARRLIHILGQPTAEGVVYRVDLRLRPYGSEGTLVSPLAMFEEYLRTNAKPAERQMMLKARAVAGDLKAGNRLLKRLAPILLQDAPLARQQVRALKGRIERQLIERGQAAGHVKLAPGGIRDVEFLVQALQLESGARNPGVLGVNTLEALARLKRAGLVAPPDAQELEDHYVFLRTVEHRMQLMENQQVYRLPRKTEDLLRLGRTMGFPAPDADRRLLDAYDQRTRKVRTLFDRVLRPPPSNRAGEAGRETSQTRALRLAIGAAGERLDDTVLRRAARLLGQVRSKGGVRCHAERNDARRWTLLYGAVDQPGLLAFLTGLLTAHGASIQRGDFLRLRGGLEPGGRIPRGGTPSPAPAQALGVFEVVLETPGGAGLWKDLKDELSGLLELGAQGRGEEAERAILERVAQRLRPSGDSERPLLPIRIETLNDPGGPQTELHLRSTDTLGFLFEFATALASLRVKVERAVIRTLDDEVYDTFWITDAQGRKITGERALEELRGAAALVKQFTHLLPRAPDPSQALRQFTALLHQMFARAEWLPELRRLESTPVLTTMAELLGVSKFLWEDFLLLQHENLFPVVVDVPGLARRRTRGDLEAALARELRGGQGGAETERRLNGWKDREMFRIDLRHITGRSEFPEFMESLSDLAEIVVRAAAESCFRELSGRLGAPRGPRGKPCEWSIGALGKFGGRELGIASDLDLVLVYEDEGSTGAPQPLPASDFFGQLVRSLLKAVKARREGSFAIDLRLRPHGDAGAMATSFGGFREYYAPGGPARPFERLSLVKLSPVAGSRRMGARLLEIRDAFVYSDEPVDYENLRHLRSRQATELVPPGETHAKYSLGGLADVEYFVQAQEIEAGRRRPPVRVPNTLGAIHALVQCGHFRKNLGSELSEAYLFLRRLIESLRVVRGYARDSVLPKPSEREFSYLMRRLQFATEARFEAEIRQRMSFVRHLWEEAGAPGEGTAGA
jgi:glutamate-ammonia-ligase adenylyltransferase